jgi:hypothetical protein
MRIQDAIELEKCGYQSDENDEYVSTEYWLLLLYMGFDFSIFYLSAFYNGVNFMGKHIIWNLWGSG